MTSDASSRSAPTEHHRAATLSIGDELVLGQTLDTNSQRLSGLLLDRGIRVAEHATVADDAELITATLNRLCASATLVIVTGGLGPTADDLTRAALARAMDDELIEDPESLEQIRAWYSGRGGSMPATNAVQALRPSRAVALQNHHGTAPGLFARVGNAEVYCLPGPPREMVPMLESLVFQAICGPPGRAVRTRLLTLVGIGESDAAERLGPLMDRARNPLVGTTASLGVVTVRIRDEAGGTESESESRLDETEAQIRRLVDPYAAGRGPIEALVLDRLRDRGERLAAVESCTGGLLSAALTAVAGSSDAFTGGWLTYTNAMKADQVGVPKEVFDDGGSGAVSRDAALAMAGGGLARARHELGDAPGVEWCLSITGVAGPGGGTEVKPVGTVWIGLAGTGGVRDARRFVMRGDRDTVRRWSVSAALAMLWMHVAHPARAMTIPLLRQAEPAI